ncbi:TPA: hypothetical protein ACXISN_003515 [Salmonella enterica subsp. enterica serovar Horsham]|nr:hypothetical protein [Salmonella enterica]EBP3774154.1 hypothetical protein [Salmonella enterica subsp. arizonae]EDU8172176.1 hypothetical protein [Salmonella enterica subsp. arizonae serovar 41:z4,z23:-]EAW8702393.1 hypothetical protein [Salmonella enterica]EBE2324813.1 hypothetical protein [Salmonella enterica]
MSYAHHGMTNTKLYNVFKGMKGRTRSATKRSKCYCGIKICEEWLNDSSLFIKWALENGYKEGMQIDRIDNLSGYSPENCRFVTPKENANNRLNNIVITVDGEVNTIAYFSDKYGIKHHTIVTRLKRGWDPESAVKKPLSKGVKNGRPYSKID